MKPAFIIAAGGTGAKTAEALIHLCAAGMGPDELDILLLDVDENNGNMKRCEETLSLYQTLQKAGSWKSKPSFRANSSTSLPEINFFHTNVTVHVSRQRIDLVKGGGLTEVLLHEDGAQPVLDLLFDQSEQESSCEKGFMARPNLGSLILAKHLSDALASHTGGAAAMKKELEEEVGKNQPIQLLVIGSVFGGTGASLLPIACNCVQRALNCTIEKWKNVHCSAIALLPYFHPKSKTDSAVDSSRFLADTISTLEHYQTSSALADYQSVYVIGSDDSKRNTLEYCEGAGDQANPCHLEELIAACAALDCLNRQTSASQQVLAFNASSGAKLQWGGLPLASSEDASRLALLAHLFTFILSPLHGSQPLSSGLFQFLQHHRDEIELLPLYQNLLGEWAEQRFERQYQKPSKQLSGWSQLADKQKMGDASIPCYRDAIAEYAWRFLLWARHAMPSDQSHTLIEFGTATDYALVWESLCALSADEIKPVNGTEDSDNALLRLCRAAACSIDKISKSQIDTKKTVLRSADSAASGFPDSGQSAESDKCGCLLPLTDAQLRDIGKFHGLNQDVYEQYTKTAEKV